MSDQPLRLAIMGYLQHAGSDSISGITRAVSDLAGAPVHRLTLAGYLAAMADAGDLDEQERPPSKHYRVSHPDRHRTLHERVAQAVLAAGTPANDQVPLWIATMAWLLGRPLWHAELAHAGFHVPPHALPTVTADDAERRRLRALVQARVAPRIAIPRGDVLVRVPAGRVAQRHIDAIVRDVLLDALDAHHLSRERARAQQTPAQAHLPTEAAP